MANGINDFKPVGCPDDCEDYLPVPPAESCRKATTALITAVFLAAIGHPFVDISDADEWATRVGDDPISGTGAVPGAIRMIPVFKGTKPADTPAQARTNWGAIIPLESPKTITFTDQNSSLANHAFHQEMNCGGKQFLMWYKTADGQVYGGNSGIVASWSSVRSIVENTDSPSKSWAVTLGWDAIYDEPVSLAVY